MNNQTPLGMIIDPWISMQKRPVVHMDEGKREGGSVLVDSNPSKEELAETPTTYKLGFYVKNKVNSAVCCLDFSIEALQHTIVVRLATWHQYRTSRAGSTRVTNVSTACGGSDLSPPDPASLRQTVFSSHLSTLIRPKTWSPLGLKRGLRCC
jgi:hypothetical protein